MTDNDTRAYELLNALTYEIEFPSQALEIASDGWTWGEYHFALELLINWLVVLGSPYVSQVQSAMNRLHAREDAPDGHMIH